MTEPPAKRPLLWRVAPIVGAALVALLALTAVVVAFRSKTQAHSSLQSAISLREARRDVAEAQSALDSSDIDDAIRSARKANSIAVRVGVQADKIARLLEPLRATVAESTAEGRRGIAQAASARRRTEVAAEVLEALAGYQRSATENATVTNRALVRILAALRETNEGLP